MSKAEIVKMLKEALLGEEKAVPIYNKHLAAAVFWSGVKKEKGQRIKEILSQLANDSKKHKAIIEEIIDQLEGSV